MWLNYFFQKKTGPKLVNDNQIYLLVLNLLSKPLSHSLLIWCSKELETNSLSNKCIHYKQYKKIMRIIHRFHKTMYRHEERRRGSADLNERDSGEMLVECCYKTFKLPRTIEFSTASQTVKLLRIDLNPVQFHRPSFRKQIVLS